MTREDLIRLAKEANIDWDLIDEDEGQIWYITTEGLARLASGVEDHVLDKCAVLAEKHEYGPGCAQAIRALKGMQ